MGEESRDAWPAPGLWQHALEAAGRRWSVSVAEPGEPGPWPTVLVLDGFATFGIATHISRTLSLLSAGRFPPLLVVGVGPDTDELAEQQRMRTRDLTPWPPVGDEASADGPLYGGGEDFLEVLATSVVPFIEGNYDADPGDRTLAGWSFGGLFAAYAALTRSELFRRHVLVSPSLYWADGAALTLASSTALTRPVDVYVAVGEHEESDASRVWPAGDAEQTRAALDHCRMVSNARTFVDTLGVRGPEGSRVVLDVLAGEHHITLWPAALTRGLLALHGDGYRVG